MNRNISLCKAFITVHTAENMHFWMILYANYMNCIFLSMLTPKCIKSSIISSKFSMTWLSKSCVVESVLKQMTQRHKTEWRTEKKKSPISKRQLKPVIWGAIFISLDIQQTATVLKHSCKHLRTSNSEFTAYFRGDISAFRVTVIYWRYGICVNTAEALKGLGQSVGNDL